MRPIQQPEQPKKPEMGNDLPDRPESPEKQLSTAGPDRPDPKVGHEPAYVPPRPAPAPPAPPSEPAGPFEDPRIPDEPTEYWCGCRLDSPRHFWNLGQATFPRVTEQVVDGDDGMTTERYPQLGVVTTLTPHEVRTALWMGMHDLHVRFVTKPINAPENWTPPPPLIVSYANPRTRPKRGDVPAGRFIYMIPIDEAVQRHGPHWRSEQNPEPICPVEESVVPAGAY